MTTLPLNQIVGVGITDPIVDVVVVVSSEHGCTVSTG
jgi:hypothetical protein